MQKFERNYKIIFEIGRRDQTLTGFIPEQEIEISYPFTLSFGVKQGANLSNAGECTLQLYNLKEEDQKALYKDFYNNEKYVLMQFYAGYQDTMPLLFFGFVTQCMSYRKGGSTEYITEIQADNNSLIALYGFVNATFTQGSRAIDIIQEMLKDNYGYSLGYITPNIKPLPRDKTFIGQTIDLLGKEYGEYNIWIDKGELNILGDNEVIPADDLMVITSESGLLGSPKRANQFLMLDMLFEPRIKVGQAIELMSDSIPWFNQIYKVQAVEHNGTISPVISGKCTTKLTLSLGETIFDMVQKSTQQTKEKPPKKINWERPVSGGSISSPWGMRVHPILKEKKLHDGVDIAVAIGTKVNAAADGKVEFVGWNGGYGRYIRINHGQDANGDVIQSFYAHLEKFETYVGAQVSKGQEIALSGNTAGTGKNGLKMTTGAHLHFGMHKNNKSINPAEYVNV